MNETQAILSRKHLQSFSLKKQQLQNQLNHLSLLSLRASASSSFFTSHAICLSPRTSLNGFSHSLTTTSRAIIRKTCWFGSDVLDLGSLNFLGRGVQQAARGPLPGPPSHSVWPLSTLLISPYQA